MNALFIDINECVEDAYSCAQICADTDGSYTCSCEAGYNLASDRHGCDGIIYIDSQLSCFMNSALQK